MKDIIIAGNWKMNTAPVEAVKLFNEIESYFVENSYKSIPFVQNGKLKFVACPPFVYLQTLQMLVNQSKSLLSLGAQNCHFESKGAFTGEVSPTMLKDLGIKYTIIGHSERRTFFAETNETISKKIKSALESDLIPIFCIGETLEERQTGKTNDILKNQIEIGLSQILDVATDLKSKIVIAYEPVWAIGTGLAATTEQVRDTHTFIKNEVKRILNLDLPILYGGSLNENNANELLRLENVNGGLIGGASLKADSFCKIIEIANSILKN